MTMTKEEYLKILALDAIANLFERWDEEEVSIFTDTEKLTIVRSIFDR